MKIIHVCTCAEMYGGAERCLIELVNKELENGITPIIVSLVDGPLISFFQKLGLRCYVVEAKWWVNAVGEPRIKSFLKRFKKYLCNVKAEKQFLKIALYEKPDLIHINTSVCALGSKTARSISVPLIWHIREFINTNGGFLFDNERHSRKIVSSADAVIAVSQAVSEEWLGYVPINKLKVVYDSVKGPEGNIRDREILNQKKISVCVIGNIAPVKGQLDIVETMIDLKSVDMKIFFIGEETDLGYSKILHQMIQNEGLEENFVFTGTIDNVYEYLSCADIIIICSRSESFGRATVEGMLSGCLVVGNANTGTKELLSDGRGILYDNSRPEKNLKACLGKAISDTAMSRNIALRGRLFAEQVFGGDKGYEAVGDIYENLLNLSHQSTDDFRAM